MSDIPYSVRGGRGGASASIETLTDTSISNLQNSEILKYNNVTSKWENAAESAVDLSAIPVNNILKKGDPAGNDFLDAELRSQSISTPTESSGVRLEFIGNTQVRGTMKSFVDTSAINQPRETITLKPSSLLNDDRVVTIVGNPPGVLPDNQKSYVGINKLRPLNDLEVGTTLTVDDYTKNVGINTAFPQTNFDVLNTFYVNSDTRKVGILQPAPAKTLQVGTTMYVDEVTRRVGINVADPSEDLQVDGSIQIQSNTSARLKFHGGGSNNHPFSEIDGDVDGNLGGDIRFYTKLDNQLYPQPTEKLRIANDGKIGLGGANYGQQGEVLTSQGTIAPPVWAALTPPTPIVGSAYHTVEIDATGNQNTGFTLTNFVNKITPVNITSTASIPFTIPAGGAGVYQISFGFWMGYTTPFHTPSAECVISNATGPRQRIWYERDNGNNMDFVTASRTLMEPLNAGDTIIFYTGLYGGSGTYRVQGQCSIFRIA